MRFAPSLAAAPLDRLGEVVRTLDQAGADYVHFDVEDGVFVPVMTLGTKLLADLRPLTSLPFDVHLMMVNPEWIIPHLVRDGANRISVHYEACPYPRRTLRSIHEAGAAAGIALNPTTPLPDLSFLLPYLRFVVLLTTEPEPGHPAFLPSVLEKLRRGKAAPDLGSLEWVVDGGINLDNIGVVAEAGADTVVVGRAVFASDDPTSSLSRLRAAATKASQGPGPSAVRL